MTLVVESARAIGCSVTDATERNLIKGDEETIRTLLIHLIRVRTLSFHEQVCASCINYSVVIRKRIQQYTCMDKQ